MGFDNSIYKFKKFKNTTLDQIFMIEDYLNYETNDWAKKNFQSALEYMQRDADMDDIPTMEQIEFYKPFLHPTEYHGNSIYDNVYDNSSAGIPFHEDIDDLIGYKEGGVVLTQTDIIKLLNYEIKKMDKYKLYPAQINYSFISTDTEEDDEDEDETITLKRCDGVEAYFPEDAVFKRIHTNSKYIDWGTLIMLPKEIFDEWDYYNQVELVNTLSDILMNTDFENECLVYCGGW